MDSNENSTQSLAQKTQSAIKTAKKIKTIWFILTSVGPLLIIVIIFGFLFLNIKANPVDNVDILYQCQIAGQPLDNTCIKNLKEKFRDQISSDDPDIQGGSANPHPTYPRT